jgi:hypothetical protein
MASFRWRWLARTGGVIVAVRDAAKQTFIGSSRTRTLCPAAEGVKGGAYGVLRMAE